MTQTNTGYTKQVNLVTCGVDNTYYYDLTVEEYFEECRNYENDGFTLGGYQPVEECRLYRKVWNENTYCTVIFKKVEV